jgi:hypothetical protein
MKVKTKRPINAIAVTPLGPIDWLAAAIGILGGPIPASKEIGVSRNLVYNWLDNGIGPAAFSTVIKLSRLTNVPLEYLALRKGPLTPEELATVPLIQSKLKRRASRGRIIKR